MSNLGFIRVAAAAPKLKPANTEYNTEQIITCLNIADRAGCGITVFPELCVTGSTCGDLFYQDLLYRRSLDGLNHILSATKNISSAAVIGLYLELESGRYNCAAYIQNGEIKGVVPKMFIPEEQSRWFSQGIAISGTVRSLYLMGEVVPFGRLLFKDPESSIITGIEISDDADHAVTPGAILSLSGANMIVNPSACIDVAGSATARRNAIAAESRKNKCAYILSSAGVHESTTDAVFGGHNIIAENGAIISESVRFNRDLTVLYADIDFEMLCHERMRARNFNEITEYYADPSALTAVYTDPLRLFDTQNQTLMRVYAKNPFLPDSPLLAAERCAEVFQIQCAGLSKRLEHLHAAKSVIGVSGGVDSTLALLVCAAVHKTLGKPADDIIALTMPGFGSTERTRANALSIINALGADSGEISINDSVLQHFRDIGHDPDIRDRTYENAQARERTQILMDIANKKNGVVIGTGDLSESALGWCTYNGDHMSMYNVNSGVPKTLIKGMIRWIIDYKLNGPGADKSFSSDNAALSYALEAVLDTPISPELLPPDKGGNIVQETETSIGPYPLNDFFIYYTIRYGFSPEKLSYIARHAFAGEYSEDTIKKWLSLFYKRFINQQFKRNCAPDGPKTGSVCLSPRGGWSMPSDADCELWLTDAAICL